MIYGYHRVSTKDQHLDRGINEIETFCKSRQLELSKIYKDMVSGKTFERPRYIVLKEDVLRAGDILIITEVDRLGRTKKEILKELEYFKMKNVRVMILEIPTTLIDLSALGNELATLMVETITNMLIEMYATLAQGEIEKKEKRQREGLDAKRARGEWDDMGRPRLLSREEFKKQYEKVLSGEKKPFELARELDMKIPTFYKYREEMMKGE